MRIHKGDTVTVLMGRDMGQTAKVDKVSEKEGLVMIATVNLSKRHVKKMGDHEGGIISIPKPMKVSKVGLVCPHCKKVTRVGYKIEGKTKTRICKKCQKAI